MLYSAADKSFLCLLIHAYPLLTYRLQSPHCSLTNPLQTLLTPLLSVFVILCFPHVYKVPGAHRSPGGIPPSIGRNYPSLSLSLSVSLYSLSLVGFSIQVYSSLSSPSHFPRLKRSLGSLSVDSHCFWMSGAPLSTCCTNL